MKYSVNWLRDFIDFQAPVERILEALTLSGTEVESVHSRGFANPQVVVAQILESKPHPNADRLSVCRVADGQGERQIVCGAKNYRVGDKVPLALPGAVLPGGLKIKKGKLRGEESEGMMCSARELELAEDAEGLLILPADAPVGRPLHEVIRGDTVFEVEVTPNRPDLLSYRGLARELAALGMGTLRAPSSTAPAEPIITGVVLGYMGEDGPEAGRSAQPSKASPWSIDLADPAGCPFYTATGLTNIQVGPSPDWLREKIESMGSKSINNVVDITNLVLWETGQPLHAFDAAKLQGRTIHVRAARPGEAFTALDGKTYMLEEADLVIADEGRPIALAGVMGGLESGVAEGTTEVVLEAAWFAPSRVRHTSRRLGLISDSSYRFERRVDPGGVLAARDLAIQLLYRLAKAHLMGSPVSAGRAPVEPREIRLRHAQPGILLGTEVKREEIRSWLEKLDLRLVREDEEASVWSAPSFRGDLEREVDLIEEIARLHGLASIPGRLNYGVAPESAADLAHDRINRLRHALAARGWDECLNDSLVPAEWAAGPDAVALANPLNEDYARLRPELMRSLLGAAARNLARGNRELRLFEIDHVFGRREGKVEEPLRLGLLVAGDAQADAWYQPGRSADFFDLKGTLDFLEHALGILPADILKSGPVPKALLREHDLKSSVFFAEVALDRWVAAAPPSRLFAPLQAFPEVRRDLAVVVDTATPHAAVLREIEGAGIPALADVRLFDVFSDPSGEKVPAGRKSLAYALTYRAPDRTLTDKEVAVWQDQIRERLQAKLGCSFRDA